MVLSTAIILATLCVTLGLGLWRRVKQSPYLSEYTCKLDSSTQYSIVVAPDAPGLDMEPVVHFLGARKSLGVCDDPFAPYLSTSTISPFYLTVSVDLASAYTDGKWNGTTTVYVSSLPSFKGLSVVSLCYEGDTHPIVDNGVPNAAVFSFFRTYATRVSCDGPAFVKIDFTKDVNGIVTMKLVAVWRAFPSIVVLRLMNAAVVYFGLRFTEQC